MSENFRPCSALVRFIYIRSVYEIYHFIHHIYKYPCFIGIWSAWATYYPESPLRQAKLVNRAFPRGWYQHHRVKQPIDDLRRHVHVNIEHCLRQWRHGWNNRRPLDLSFSAVLPIFLSSIDEFRTVPSEIEKSDWVRVCERVREQERERRERREKEKEGEERSALPQGTNNRVSQACLCYTRARTRFHQHKSIARVRGTRDRGWQCNPGRVCEARPSMQVAERRGGGAVAVISFLFS